MNKGSVTNCGWANDPGFRDLVKAKEIITSPTKSPGREPIGCGLWIVAAGWSVRMNMLVF